MEMNAIGVQQNEGEEEEDGDIVFQAIQYDNADFLAELLSENRELVGAMDGNGRTSLHFAALEGHSKCAELLIQAGADIDAVSGIPDSLRTPLEMAAANGRAEILRLLIENGADLFYNDSDGHSALLLAQMNGHQQCAYILISAIEKVHHEAKMKNQQLCSACIDGNLSEMLGILADLGHKNVRNEILNGPAESEQKSALYLATENGRAELVNELLNISGHLIIFEPTGDNILHAAIASKDIETVKIILKKFPFLMDASNQEKNFPIHWACRCGNPSIVQFLLEYGNYPPGEMKFFEFPHENQRNGTNSRKLGYLFPCDLNAPDHEGRSPLYLAVIEGNAKIVEILSKFKLPVYVGSNSIGVKTNSMNQMMEEGSPFVFDTYVNGRTPLMIACTNGYAEIVRLLLESGHVDVNLPIALTEAETNTADEAHCLDGSGALIEATKRGNLSIIRLLFWHGAFDYRNRALDEIMMKERDQQNGGNDEIIGLFLEHLTFGDIERKIIWPSSKSSNLEKISKATGNLLAFQNSTGQMTTIKACQLNWAATGILELKLEWLMAAANRMNPQLISMQQIKHFPLCAITRIDISANKLKTIPAFLFTQLPFLFQLDCSKNSIRRLEMPPEGSDWQCPQLELLIVEQNQLEELPSQLFSGQHFPRLCQFNAQANRLRRVPASIWTAYRLIELNLANNELNELNSIVMDLRRTSHSQLYRQGGTAATRISRYQREKKEEKEKSGGILFNKMELEERKSRSTTKRESPHQKSANNSRQCSNEKQNERGMGGKIILSATESEGIENGLAIVEMDILRTNIWQKRIQLSNIDDNTEENNKDGQEMGNNSVENGGNENNKQIGNSSLQILNLAGNKFTRMPTCLACCCPRLNRLDFSRNLLTSLGPIECLPSALRHLDFSSNKLSQCFVKFPTHLKQKLRNCEAQNSIREMQNVGVIQGNSMARHSRSRSKSVARNQRSLSVVRQANGGQGKNIDGSNISDNFCCLHKSHCRLEALKNLNLANNSLNSLELLLTPLAANESGKPMNAAELSILLAKIMAQRQFDWKQGGEHLKPYLLFPSLTSLNVSGNRLNQLPQVISLHNSLAVLNLANNFELECLPPELGLLDKLWNIGLNGCSLKGEIQQIRQFVEAGNYKTAEVLSYLRQRLENSIVYPKMKLMFLGGSSVGKTTLLHQMRLEGTVPKKHLQHESWSRRMGHSPVKGFPIYSSPSHNHQMGRSSSQQRISQSISLYPVEVAEWIYEPKRSSSKSTSTPPPSIEAFKGPITFRTWDFDGIKQKEQLSIEICFFTRRCLYLLLWKVTDGEIALDELQEWLIAIQERAPNSSVLIIGTHSDFVREQGQRFPKDYLTKLDQQIQTRFIVGIDPEKRGLPRVLGSLYLSCRSREDVKSLCSLVYTCAGHIGTGRSGSKLKLAEKVPSSFVALEQVVVNMTDEMRENRQEPILHFHEFWSLISERLLLEAAGKPIQFRDIQDFRQACLFLQENGILCYFDNTFLRDYIFLDPPWLCSILRGIFSFAANQRLSTTSESSPSSFYSSLQSNFLQVHQNSLADSTELYAAIKQSFKQHLLLTNTFFNQSSNILNPSEHSSFSNKYLRLFRQCGISLLRKFELALPFHNGKLSLLASFLPDEYLLRADYPGSKVRSRTKFDKLKLRWANIDKPRLLLTENLGIEQQSLISASPIRNYLEQRRLSRTIAPMNIENNGSEMAAIKSEENGSAQLSKDYYLAKTNDWVKILEIEQIKEQFLRRLYVMHYVPQGFWPRIITRLLDDERLGDALSKLLLLSRANESTEMNTAEEDGAAFKLDAIAMALAKALNSGKVFNLAQQQNSVRRHQNEQKNKMEEEDDELETSFIVLNPAEEVTEESIESATNGQMPSTMVIRCCEKGMEASDDDGGEMMGNSVQERGNGIQWLLWKTGVEIRILGIFLLSFRQFLPLASVQDLNYSTHQLFRRFEDAQWRPLTTPNEEGHQQGLGHMVELLVPKVKIRLKWRNAFWELRTDRRVATKVLVLVSSIIDDLLEDWYPQLGTRFVLSSQGLLLVDRLIPCDRCSIDAIQEEERYWLRENINRNPAASADFIPSRPTRSISTKFNEKNDAKQLPKSKSSTTTPLSSAIIKNQPIDGIDLNQHKPILATIPSPVYLFSMEECILEARKTLKNSLEEIVDDKGNNIESRLECPRHGPVGLVQMEGRNENRKNGPDLARMCPDLLFTDLQDEWLIPSGSIRRGKMLGRGAFGFVFTGTISGSFRRKTNSIDMAALKILEPVEQNGSSIHQLDTSAQAAFRAFDMKWQNDIMEQATRAYCMARQEICMLSELAHPNCTQMLAFCAKPMTLLLELAPTGSLYKILTEFRRCGQRLHVESLQRANLQIAKALEYLHVNQHIIYRDLKSENVLVWRFPSPNAPGRQKSLPPTDVLLKLGDYGISRFSYPSGVCKGYGGTEGFMAPEIMRYNGEQEYTERVDCFSFGMFLYELVTLRQPYEGFQMQQMKERILGAQRPNVTEKELLNPTNVLDLMVACWEERAELRPSSSQLVGICSAPEYMHLLDIALLKDGEQANALALGIIQQLAGAGGMPEDEQRWICWIPCENGREDESKSQSNIISLLQCSPFGWTEKKLFKLPNANVQSPPLKRHQIMPKITAIAQIYDEFLWLGDEAGNLVIFEIEKQGAEVPIIEEAFFRIDLTKTLENCPKQIAQFQRNVEEEMPTHEFLKRATPISASKPEFGTLFAILQIGTFPERKIIIIALCSAILLCRWQGRGQSPQFITSIQLGESECRLFCMAILPSLGDWQIWTGHSNGCIFIHHISSSNNKLAFSTSVNHFGGKGKMAAQKVSSVFFLIASKCIRNLLWSVMENDSLLFMWRNSQLQKILNCAKILPVSESLSSIEGPEEVSNNPHYITALELIDLGSTEEGEEQLLVGTSRGILLIIRAVDLQPISSFRPYFGPIHRIIGCPPNTRFRPSTSRILQNELLSATNNLTASLSVPQTKTTKKRSTVMEKSRSIMLKAAGLQNSMEGKHPMERQKSLENPLKTTPFNQSNSSFGIFDVRNEVRSAVDEFCGAVKYGMRDIFEGNEICETKCPEENTPDLFFVTIGAEYRPLLNRFIGNMPETKDVDKGNCAIFWRATNHWCTQQNK